MNRKSILYTNKWISLVLITLFLFGSGIVNAEEDIHFTTINLKSTGAQVNYTDNIDSLDKMVYDALNISILDENNKKVVFSRSDIILSYIRSPGTQKVTVTYKGNKTYLETEATAEVKIISQTSTNIVMANNVPTITLVSDRDELNKVVIDALSIKVVDSKGNTIKFAADELEISYNHDVGTQVVTARYKGNSQYSASTAEAKIRIISPQKTSITMANGTPKIQFYDSKATMDKSIIDTLKVQVLNEGKKPITYTQNELEISYNRAAGKQDVTIKYLGNNNYKPAEATGTIQVINPQSCALILNQNPPEVHFDDNKNKLDLAVYQSLNIKLSDSKNKEIRFDPKDITLTYNREEGAQKVTVNYNGNDEYSPCSAQITVNIGPSVTQIITWSAIGGGILLIAVIVTIIIIVRKRRMKRQ